MKTQLALLTLATSGLLLASVLVRGAERRGTARKIDKAEGQREPRPFKSPCGTGAQVATRVATCMDELFELVEGRFGEPKTDDDIVGHCNRFNRTERCVRVIAKDCLSGIHKAATSAVSSAIKRFKAQECKTAQSRWRYAAPLKCAITQGPKMEELYRQNTAIMQTVRDLPIIPEEKLVKMCCLINNMDKEIKKLFDAACPQHTPIVMGIVQAMTEDARNTLCANPKCKGVLESLRPAKLKPSRNLLEPIAEILYSLSVD